MKCPICKNINMEKVLFFNTEVDYCPRCLGLWFEEDELRQAKDEKDKDLNWLDIDLWKEKGKFKVEVGNKICPKCSVPLYEVLYGDSDVKVSVCNMCKGIFLERGEFKRIIDYLKNKEKEEVLYNYFKNLIEEGKEVFSGPETFKEELKDFFSLLKLLNYKLRVQHPVLSGLISMLPK